MALDRDETSERVLEIAEALVSEGGTSNLKARTVAERAGIAVGSVYNLYGDMDGLHTAVNIRLMAALAKAGQTALVSLAGKPGVDTQDYLLALARAYLEFVDANSRAWTAMVAFSPEKVPAAERKSYIGRLDGLLAIIGHVLANDKSLVLAEGEHTLTARVLWSSVHGIVTNSRRGRGDSADFDRTWQQIEHLVSVFMIGLKNRRTSVH